MSFINSRRVRVAVCLASAVAAVSLGTGGAASAGPTPYAAAKPSVSGPGSAADPGKPASRPAPKDKQPPRPPAATKSKSNGAVRFYLATGVQETVRPRFGNSGTIGCYWDKGERVVGGGIYNDSPGDVVLVKSGPSANHWDVAVYNNSNTSTFSFRAYAICAVGLDLDEYEINHAWMDITESGPITWSAGCSRADKKILSGGAVNSSLPTGRDGDFRINTMRPIPELDVWWNHVYKVNSDRTETYHNFVICGTVSLITDSSRAMPCGSQQAAMNKPPPSARIT